MSVNNIVQLQKLFDAYIYSKLNEEKLIDLASTKSYLVSELSWENIYEYFSNKNDFYNSLDIYAATIIQQKDKQNNFETFSLISLCHVNDANRNVLIKHDPCGLRLYLYRKPDAIIHNSYIKGILSKSLERFNIKEEVLYSILFKGYQYNCTPEELKEILGVNYINSMLKVRVLSPVEKKIYELFESGNIPAYFQTEYTRSVIGKGSKIIRINFKIIDNIVLLRLHRMRKDYMKYIMQEIMKLFPFDYPFIEVDIDKKEDKIVEDIYNMIKHIEKDPDYTKLATSTLVRYKLLQDYDIKIAMP